MISNLLKNKNKNEHNTPVASWRTNPKTVSGRPGRMLLPYSRQEMLVIWIRLVVAEVRRSGQSRSILEVV